MKDSRHEVIHFWFGETDPSLWFQINPDFDAVVRDRFRLAWQMAKDGLCDTWKGDADGCLALCLLLDQFPRNMFRGKPESFSTDDRALLVAKHAVARGFDQLLPPEKRRYIYQPYGHSEKLPDQRKGLELYAAIRKDDPLGYEKFERNLKIIERFDRFPRRNAVLGREDTPEEAEYLSVGT